MLTVNLFSWSAGVGDVVVAGNGAALARLMRAALAIARDLMDEESMMR